MNRPASWLKASVALTLFALVIFFGPFVFWDAFAKTLHVKSMTEGEYRAFTMVHMAIVLASGLFSCGCLVRAKRLGGATTMVSIVLWLANWIVILWSGLWLSGSIIMM